MRNVAGKIVEETEQSNKFFSRSLFLYEVKWKNIEEPDRPQVTL